MVISRKLQTRQKEWHYFMILTLQKLNALIKKMNIHYIFIYKTSMEYDN